MNAGLRATIKSVLLARCHTVIHEAHMHIIGPAKRDECRRMLAEAGFKLAERRGLVEAWVKPAAAAQSMTR